MCGMCAMSQIKSLDRRLMRLVFPFLYPLKTSENCKVFWFFQGIVEECIGNKWVKYLFSFHFRSILFLSENQIFSDIFRATEK